MLTVKGRVGLVGARPGSGSVRIGVDVEYRVSPLRKRFGDRLLGGLGLLELQLLDPFAAPGDLFAGDADLAQVVVGLLEVALQLADTLVEPAEVFQ